MMKLDFTNEETTAEAEQKAKDLGITRALENEKGTGFVIIYHQDSPDDYRVLRASSNLDRYIALMKEVSAAAKP